VYGLRWRIRWSRPDGVSVVTLQRSPVLTPEEQQRHCYLTNPRTVTTTAFRERARSDRTELSADSGQSDDGALLHRDRVHERRPCRVQAMTRLILLVLAALSIAAQRPPDESNVPPNEKRVPPSDYCKAKGVPIGPKETRAHTCECSFSCTIDERGTVTEHEGPTCLTYCHVNGRRLHLPR
jgi:hypothetical protein